MRRINFLLICIAVVFLSGCLSVKSYVDPTFGKTRYEDLVRPTAPLPLKVAIEFQRNGKAYPRAEKDVRGHVERVLRASGNVVPATDATDEIKVVLNNVADIGGAVGKGIGTGLTFGAAGSLVQDGYEMTVSVTRGGKTVTKTGYRHILWSTVGNKKGPPGMTPTTLTDGFATIVEQLILNALKDLQADGLIALRPIVQDLRVTRLGGSLPTCVAS
jgi:hypothetical protein